MNSWIIEPQVNYKRAIFNGNLDFLLGTTIQQNTNNGVTFIGTGYNSDAVLKDMLSASTITVGSTVSSQYKYNALFGRLNYNWNDKYIVDLTARRDGSSRFGPQNQFHNFVSVGVAWIFSQENWFKDHIGVLSFGKLRGSYGTTGSDQIGDYRFMNLYTPTIVEVPYQNTSGLLPSGLSNPYLQWEETKKLQGGLELGFLRDRILVTANYSYNRSSNQLLGYALPVITGFGSISENFPATIENTGLELVLNTTNIKTKDFTWSTGFNMTLPSNKVVAFPNIAFSSYASGTNGVIVGQPLGVVKVYHFLGVDPTSGKYVVADAHGNATSSPNALRDKTVLINTRPKFYGGIENRFIFKGFELDFLFQFVNQTGKSLYTFGNNDVVGTPMLNQPVSVLNRWQKPGDITSIQRFNSNYSLFSSRINAAQSDYAYCSASFVRLKNLSLSWQLPHSWQQKIHLQNARIFVLGQNLLTITKYTGLDPESQSSTLPPLKVFTAGLQVGL